MIVHHEPAAVVGGETGGRQVQSVGGAGATDAVQRLVGNDLLAAGEVDAHARAVLVVDRLHVADRLAQPQRNPALAQVIRKRVHDFRVDERQQARALVDERDAHPQRGKDAGIFAADDAGADDGEGARQLIEAQDVVADEDALAIKGDMGILGGSGADGEHDELRGDIAVAAAVQVGEPHGMGVHKRGHSLQHLHPVARQL
jgi:hypothetical protein